VKAEPAMVAPTVRMERLAGRVASGWAAGFVASVVASGTQAVWARVAEVRAPGR